METFSIIAWSIALISSLLGLHTQVKRLLDKNVEVFVYKGLYYRNAKKVRWLMLVAIITPAVVIFMISTGLNFGQAKLSFWIYAAALITASIQIFLRGWIAHKLVQKSYKLSKQKGIASIALSLKR